MPCKHTEGPKHDCDYVTRRDRLIPAAEHHAFRVAGPAPEGLPTSTAFADWATAWNRAFHDGMTHLWEVERMKERKFRESARVELDQLYKRWRGRGVTPEMIDAAMRSSSAAS